MTTFSFWYLLGRILSWENLTIFCLALHLFAHLSDTSYSIIRDKDKNWALIAHPCCLINFWLIQLTEMSDSNFINFRPGRKYYQPHGRHKCLEVITYSRVFSNFKMSQDRLRKGSPLALQTHPQGFWFPTGVRPRRFPGDSGDPQTTSWETRTLNIYKWTQRMILLTVFSLAVFSVKFLNFLWECPPTGSARGLHFVGSLLNSPKKVSIICDVWVRTLLWCYVTIACVIYN